MDLVLQNAALVGGILLAAMVVVMIAGLAWLALDDDRGVWTVPQLARLATARTTVYDARRRPACDECRGRHCAGCEPAKAAGWHWYRGVHNDGLDRWLRVVGDWWRPPAPSPRRRRVQLELARRLRAAGVPTRLAGTRAAVLP